MFLSADTIVKISWLTFLLADSPRLIFRVMSSVKLFDYSHRTKRYSVCRIITQAVLQNILYFISLALMYVVYKSDIFIIMAICYAIPLAIRVAHQVKAQAAYVATDLGHFMNNYIIKPTRMAILIAIAIFTQQAAWLIGLGIIASKWILTIFYEKLFDVPNWYHAILVLLSACLTLAVYPIDLGIIKEDNMRALLTTIPGVFSAYVGLLGVFLTLSMASKEDDQTTKKYFYNGIILNFSFASLLIILCLLAIIMLADAPFNMTAINLFKQSVDFSGCFAKYILFGLVLSLSILLFFYTIMTAHIMLFSASEAIPEYWKRDN